MEFNLFLNKIKEVVRLKYMGLYFENPNLNKVIDKLLENILFVYSDFGESVSSNGFEGDAKKLMGIIENLIENRNQFTKLNAGVKDYFDKQKGLFDKILIINDN